MTFTIALVFPIHNNLEYTKKGLSDIYCCFDAKKTDVLPIEIVITDDGSTDGSYEWIQANFPNVILQKGNGNLWWSGGINMAVKHVLENLNMDYVLLWNNDISPDNNYFKNLFEILKNIDSKIIVCSKIYIKGADNIVSGMGGKFNPKTGEICLHAWNVKDSFKYQKPFNADWFSGMGTLIPVQVFSKIGLFDEKKFPQYYGDADFGLRAKKAGFKLIVFPQLKIFNDRSNTALSNDKSTKIFVRSLFSLKSQHNLYRNILFFKRHASSVLVYKTLIKNYFNYIAGFFKWKILGLFGLKRKKTY